MRIDWLSVSFPADRLDEVREYISYFEGTFLPKIGGMSGYAQCEASASGVRLAYTPHRKDALITLPGGANALNGEWSALVGVCDMLAEVGGRCSRMDVAFDETDGLFDMDDVIESAAARQFLYFRTRDIHCGDSGRTVYLGKRGKNGGSKYVCIYDKAAEQGLVGVHWNRIEVRFQKAGAHLVWWDFVRRTREKQSELDVRAALCRWISGAVDFRQDGRDGARQVERRPMLAWWKKVADRLGMPQRLSLPPKKVHIETFAAWFESAIGPSLAFARILSDSFGDDFAQILSEILDNNAHRVRWTKLDARLAGVTRERLRAAFKVHAA